MRSDLKKVPAVAGGDLHGVHVSVGRACQGMHPQQPSPTRLPSCSAALIALHTGAIDESMIWRTSNEPATCSKADAPDRRRPFVIDRFLAQSRHSADLVLLYGYDVRPFETDGQERLFEIKTTCGHERTAFWLTRREVDVAAERSGIYRIRRVFHFRNRAQMFEIAPPLDRALLLTPTTFLGAPR
jgi:hypothetical protein